MKHTLAAIAALLFLFTCTTLVYEARYDVALSSVTRQQSGTEVKRFADVHGHTFEDEFVRITWTPFETQLGLILVNKASFPQHVMWNDVSYIGLDGKSSRAIHEGVKLADHPVSMPPTIIAPGDTLLDLLEPISHIDHRKGGRADPPPNGGSNHAPLIGFTRGTSEAEVQSKMLHGTIQIFLPIEMNGTTRDYLFRLSVKGNVVPAGWSS